MATDLANGLIFYLILALSIALHEFGHAKAADRLGDPLPRLQGRVTLNPLVHLDPIGTGLIPLSMIFLPILMGSHLPFALIGWGKPVQIALNHPRTRVRDEILITLAGPAMNLLIALAAAVCCRFALPHLADNSADSFANIIYATISINCALIAFNLIPLPPLDGSRILRHIVGMSEQVFYSLASNSWWILLLLINFGPFRTLLGLLMGLIAGPFLQLANLTAG